MVDSSLQINVRRSKNPDIDRDRIYSPQSMDFMILQKPQQFDLQTERNIPDFIQKERAALRGFDPAFSLLDGPR